MSKTATPSKVVPAKGAKPDASKQPRARVEKVPHPMVGNTDKKRYPFTMTREEVEVDGKTFAAVKGNFPADYSVGKHERLAGPDFATPADYSQFKLSLAERLVAKLTEQRNNKLTGKKGGTASVDRFKKMLAKAAEIRQKLIDSGMSEDELSALEQEEVGGD